MLLKRYQIDNDGTIQPETPSHDFVDASEADAAIKDAFLSGWAARHNAEFGSGRHTSDPDEALLEYLTGR